MAILGKAGVTAKKNYVEGAACDKLTIVRSEGASWLSVADVPEGNSPSEDSPYWLLIARDGRDGTTAKAGDNISVTNNTDGTQTISYTGTKTIISDSAPSETENVLWVKPTTN